MSNNLPPAASYWNLDERQLLIFYLIGAWFNGVSLTIDGEKRTISTHTELPLGDMFRAEKWEYDYENGFDLAHERLLSKDLLDERYICRRKINWVPTEEGIRAIRECLKSMTSLPAPSWASDKSYATTDASSPLYGDPNEGLLHRKGVLTAAKHLRFRPWTTKDPRGYEHDVRFYPEISQGESCHDLHIGTTDPRDDIGVEVITDNNNRDYLIDKWERFCQEDRITFWIFDSRKTACEFFNHLHSRSLFELDGGKFRTPSNWSATEINRRIWRSRCLNAQSANRVSERGDAADLVYTITGLLEGDRDLVQNLIEEYYSKN